MRIAEELKSALQRDLAPERVEIEDQSARHHGHTGWRESGETHFHVLVVSARFTGRSRIERQRLVHRAAGDLLREKIHALSITALAPGEPMPRD